MTTSTALHVCCLRRHKANVRYIRLISRLVMFNTTTSPTELDRCQLTPLFAILVVNCSNMWYNSTVGCGVIAVRLVLCVFYVYNYRLLFAIHLSQERLVLLIEIQRTDAYSTNRTIGPVSTRRQNFRRQCKLISSRRNRAYHDVKHRQSRLVFNPLMDTLKPQSNGPLYSKYGDWLVHWPSISGLLHSVQRG